MKHRAALLLAVLCCVGCIDEFTTPLDPQPVGQLDPRLIGVWACVPTGPASDFHPKDRDGRKGTFAVFEFGASGPWYRIRTVGLDQADREEFWDAYPSTLGDRTVLNVWPNSDQPRKPDARVLFFAQTWTAPDRFEFHLVMSKPLKGSPLSPAPALRNTLLARASDPEVFKSWLDCTRAKVINSSETKKPF